MNFIKIQLWLILLFLSKISYARDWWVFWDSYWNKLRSWDINLDDIPNMIKNAIEFFLWISGTVSIIFIIIWWYQIIFGSLSQDKTKWRNTVLFALGWFIISTLAWFIVQFIFANFTK